MVTRKSRAEIERMRRAGRVVGEILDIIEAELRPGVSTAHLDALAEAHIRASGGARRSRATRASTRAGRSRPASCISIDDEIVHGIPGERTIRAGQIVSVDAGAIVDGWHGDGARTFYVGDPPARVAELIDLTREAMMAGIAAAVPGNHIDDISAAVEAVAGARGLGVIRQFVGHGIGTEMHEEPQVPNYRTAARPQARAEKRKANERPRRSRATRGSTRAGRSRPASASRSTTRSSTASPASGRSAPARSCRSTPARSSTAGTATAPGPSTSAIRRPGCAELIDLTRAAMMAGIAAAVPGNHIEDISVAVEAVAAQAGLGVIRQFVGHGIGTAMHEEPQVPNFRTGRPGRKLEAGLCLAIEPMFTLGGYDTRIQPDDWTVVTADGSLAAHFEHSIAITEDGPEILTVA